jgi:hypothetical protein
MLLLGNDYLNIISKILHLVRKLNFNQVEIIYKDLKHLKFLINSDPNKFVQTFNGFTFSEPFHK